MKKLLLSITLMLSVAIVFGQELSKEELKAQKKQIKALMGVVRDAENQIINDPSLALSMMQSPIENELVNNNPYVWYVLVSAKKAVIDTENNLNYLKQPFDAEKLYKNAYEIYDDLARCSELDQLPNAKGKVAPKYTDEIKAMRADCRYILYNGGIHYYSEDNYSAAAKYFAKFADLKGIESLSDVLNNEQDITILNDAAFNATMCGLMVEDYPFVLKYVENLKEDPERVELYYDYKVRALNAVGDSVAWLATLKEGVKEFPGNEIFQNNLIQYYDSKGLQDELVAFMDEMIANNPSNALFHYVKGYIFHSRDNYDVAVECYKKAIELKPDYVEAYNNQALCYLKQAQDYSNSQSSTKITDREKLKKDREVLKGYYSKALPLMEKVRELAPDRKNIWLNGLANCYYGLQMDDKLAEIEKLMEE
jgi:tetratricopeptide (TPR) repeat protein